MQEIDPVEKKGKNAQQGYRFRSIDQVYVACQRVMAKNGVFVVPKVINSQRETKVSKNGGTISYSILDIEYSFYAEDGSFVRAVVTGEAMDPADKASNKAMSAALKYVLFQVFMIPTEGDNDADATTHSVISYATDEQKEHLLKLAEEKGYDLGAVMKKMNVTLGSLPMPVAEKIINKLT